MTGLAVKALLVVGGVLVGVRLGWELAIYVSRLDELGCVE